MNFLSANIDKECNLDLDVYAIRCRKGLAIEKEYRDEMYNFLFEVGWPN